MAHICYIYIYQYGNLSNLELAIDPHYKFEFDADKKELSIESQNVLPENFWGPSIYSLTGIFGNNGAGKSTSIRFILEAIIEGSGAESVNNIVVYENNGRLQIICPDDIKINPGQGLLYEKLNSPKKIDTFYYSGHFSPEHDRNNIFNWEPSGSYNASVGFRLQKDFTYYSNSDNSGQIPISICLNSYIWQNNYRICKLLIDDRLPGNINGFKFPRYIFLKPNQGGQFHLKNESQADDLFNENTRELEQLEIYINEQQLNIADRKNWTLARFIHHCLLNRIDILDKTYVLTLLKEWYDFLESNEKVLSKFHDFVERKNDIDLRKIDKVLSILNDCRINYSGVFYLDLKVEKDKETILDLIVTAQKNDLYLTTRFFDLYFSHDANVNTKFSSGEQAMLNLFSLIYDAVVTRPQKFENIRTPRFLALDEAELGFHPEWQRNFISMLVNYINTLQVEKGHDFQIILTSHSPILLSDIPSCCCNYLESKGDGTMNVRDSQPETFSNNVFELYRNSFFLQDGLIGCYAAEKLKKLEKDIKKGKDGVVQMINLIGDKRLKLYFEDLFMNSKAKRKEKELLIKEYQKRINQLREHNDE